MTTAAERISPQTARDHLASSADALLVCAYDDEDKFAQNHLDGAISLSEFEDLADSLHRDREVIFYCA